MFDTYRREKREKVVRDLIYMGSEDEETFVDTPLLGEQLKQSKSTNSLEEDILSNIDELADQEEKAEKSEEQSAKRKLSQSLIQPESNSDLKNEDIDTLYVKAPTKVPPIPSALKTAPVTPKILPPPPVIAKIQATTPPPIPTHLKKTNWDIDFEIHGDEQPAVTIFLKGPGVKCLAPTTTEILCISTGVDITNIDTEAKSSENTETTQEVKPQVSYGSYQMRQFVNPKLTDSALDVTLYRLVAGKIARIEVNNADVLIKRGTLVCAVPQPSETAVENYLSINYYTSDTNNLSLDRVTGLGFVFVQCGGNLITKTLSMGQEILVRSDAVVAAENTVTITSNDEDRIENMDLKISGPGLIYLQTRP